jgi:choline-glycine betaine transporter
MADEERGGVRRWAVRIGSVLVALLLLYVLSIAPVYVLLVDRNSFTGERAEWFMSFYKPLFSLARQSPWFRQLLVWYLSLWQ